MRARRKTQPPCSEATRILSVVNMSCIPTHGHASNWKGRKPSREYRAWSGMWTRCTNQNDSAFKRYGALGVGIARRWRSFENFLADMGPCPPGYTLERKNPHGNYTPQNCCWASPATQARNKRETRYLKYRSVRQPLITWAEQIGIQAQTLRRRLALGWTLKKALTAPINETKRRASYSRHGRHG